MISLICGILKNYTNELIYKIDIDPQEKKNKIFTEGERRVDVGRDTLGG